MVRSGWLAALLIAAALHAADAPFHLEYTCTSEDINTFGLACSGDDPCPVFLELSSVESTGLRLFVSGNLHTESTTLYAVLLASSDGGKTWIEPLKRVPSATLEEIQFVDLQTGWISGEHVDSLPRDPFLLLTTDGGSSWTARQIFEDSRVGSISQFWFESKTQGELVVDRRERGAIHHDVFQSNTGGESWEIKQSTESSVKLKGHKDEATWHLRADSPTKTFRLERRAGSSWETVASFLIHVSDCK